MWAKKCNKLPGQAFIIGVALGCRASAIIYQNTRVYGDYQLIIAINTSTRQLTVQPNATSNTYTFANDYPMSRWFRVFFLR